MPKLPSISGKKLISVLSGYGFSEVRRKGSHVFMRRDLTKLCTVVPVHANEDLGKGLLRSILNDLELDAVDLIAMLKKNKTAVESQRLDRLSH